MSWLARLLRRRQSIPDAPPLREDFFENPPERFGVSRKVHNALRAERDALKEQVAELEAEVARLRASNDSFEQASEVAIADADRAERERDALKAEVDRLRKALRRIDAGVSETREGYRLKCIARAALEGEDDRG